MKLIRNLLVLVIILSFFSFSFAQKYDYSLGVRGGISSGLSFKSFGDTSITAIEFFAGIKDRNKRISALFERHFSLFNVSSSTVQAYIGAGVHVGKKVWKNKVTDIDESSPMIGVDGIIGIEYQFSRIPIAISLDYRPFVEQVFTTGFYKPVYEDVGITIKYTFFRAY